jgi:hypothetical protein
MLERVLTIVPADDIEAGSAEPLIRDLRDSLADPVQIGLTGPILEGQYQEKLVMYFCRECGGFCGGLIVRMRQRCEESAEQRERGSEKQRAQWRIGAHAAVIIVRGAKRNR